MLTSLIFGLFGLVVGSFLNVAVLRWNTGRSIVGTGEASACMSCAAPLQWYELLPVVSWLALRGRCRTCGSRISLQYPFVELITGIFFAVIGLLQGFHVVYMVLFALTGALLIAIAVYDMRHTIIPNAWSYSFAVLALLAMGTYFLRDAQMPPLLYLSAGPIAALPLFTLWLVSRGRWMGMGDAKLALGIGWLLGPLYGIVAVFFAFMIGAVVSVGILVPLPAVVRRLQRWGIMRMRAPASYTMKSEVPFGPFLIASCMGIWIALLYGVDVASLLFGL